jgi:hypothetical protein
MADFDPITGGCYCGAVCYEATAPPLGTGMCHCRMCQRWTGSAAMMGVFFDFAHFGFTRGTPAVYMTSAILERHFCRDCGTGLGHHYVHGPSKTREVILIGTLDHPEVLDGPGQYFGIESHLPHWLLLDDGVKQIRADSHEGNLSAWKEAGVPPGTPRT